MRLSRKWYLNGLVVGLSMIFICHSSFAEKLKHSPPASTTDSNSSAITIKDCDVGSSLQYFQCVQGRLTILEQQMNEQFQQTKNSLKGQWNQTAELEERKTRMDTAQDSWLKYRDAQCLENYKYWTKAPVLAPSISLEIAGCKFNKTVERLDEIKKMSLAN